MRLFIAINFPDEVKAVVAAFRDLVKRAALRGNFTFDENLHLTLVFLGECNFQQEKSVRDVLNETVFSEFALTIEKTGAFKRDGGHIWWIGLQESKPLSALQADLTQRFIHQGFVLDNRKYTPHVTIGREVIMPAGFVYPAIERKKFNVTSIELMKSEHIKGKLVYTPIFSKK